MEGKRAAGPVACSSMHRALLVFVALIVACTGGAESSTTTVPSTTTTVEEATTTTLPPQCAPPPYAVGVLPEKVEPTIVDASEVPRHPYLEVPGTSSVIWVDGDGDLAMALVRGTLPLEEWPGERGEVFIDGARAAVGPMGDGSWTVGWFEQPGDRCDLFTMVFFPPIGPTEVEATLESMDRTAG